MKIISVRAPWPWFMFHAGKDIENRSRNIAGGYRGPVIIHQSSWWKESEVLHDIKSGWEMWEQRRTMRREDLWSYELKETCGHLIGVVDLVAVFEPRDKLMNPWKMDDQFGLMFQRPRLLKMPLPFKARLGLFDAPPEIVAQVRS